MTTREDPPAPDGFHTHESRTVAVDAHYKVFFEQSHTMCMVLDPHTPNGIPVTVGANKAAFEAHGYTSLSSLEGPSRILMTRTGGGSVSTEQDRCSVDHLFTSKTRMFAGTVRRFRSQCTPLELTSKGDCL